MDSEKNQSGSVWVGTGPAAVGSCVAEQDWAVDSREGLLAVVGFDATDVVRRRGVQGLHQEGERRAELKRNEPRIRTRTRKFRETLQNQNLTWCPTVFLCSLLRALGTVFMERMFTLDGLEGTSFFSWNRSATS